MQDLTPTPTPDVPQTCSLQVPEAIEALVIAELENELAYVIEVSVNGRIVVVGRSLIQGQQLRIPVRPGDEVQLIGYYVPNPRVRYIKPDPLLKNSLIARYIRNAT